jgi:hypothetical protein
VLNIEERNHQVGFMGDIYHEASEVIIWISCAEGGSIPTISVEYGKGLYELAKDVLSLVVNGCLPNGMKFAWALDGFTVLFR